MNHIILKLHIISSFIPSILSLVIIYRAVIGLMKDNKINSLDIQLPKLVVIFLYIQLILGVILYVIHVNEYSVIENTEQYALIIKRRFWALEHLIMMVFALAFSHIAYIYARNLAIPKLFFRKSLLFFITVFILIATSMGINALRYI